MSNSEINKLMFGTKNGTKVSLRFSSNVIGDSDDKDNFPRKLLLTNTQVPKLGKAFTNGSSANMKFSKTQLHRIGQSGGFLDRLLETSLKTGLPLTKNVLKPLAKVF